MDIKRFMQLLESKLGDVRPLIIEQSVIIKQGKPGDPYQYKKVGNTFYYSKRNSENWIQVTKPSAIESVKTKVFNIKSEEVIKKTDNNIKSNFCPTISKNTTDIEGLNELLSLYKNYDSINITLNSLARLFNSLAKFPLRISCQMALNKIRPLYKDKNLIVVDTLSKLLYVFDKNGKFIEKTEIISGQRKQSEDPKVISKALEGWVDSVKSLGFKWVNNKWVDTTGKNRVLTDDLVNDTVLKNIKTRFLPKGIYTTGKKIESDPEYAGDKDNVVWLYKNGTELFQAIHGYFVEPSRTEVFNLTKKLMTNPKDPSVTKEFLNAVSSGKVNLSQSYGCINLPKEFVPILKTYMTDSYVFNIGESGDNYLVNNTQNYFDKMTNSENCPSPSSLGAEPITGFESGIV